LSWKILERGDNPVIQVVYAGKRDAPITLEGRIKGQQSIKQVAWPAASAAAMWRLFVTFMVGGVIGLAAGLIVLPAKSTRRNLIIGVLSLLTVLVVYYFLAAFFPSFLK
jgi:hypothetical protein